MRIEREDKRNESSMKTRDASRDGWRRDHTLPVALVELRHDAEYGCAGRAAQPRLAAGRAMCANKRELAKQREELSLRVAPAEEMRQRHAEARWVGGSASGGSASASSTASGLSPTGRAARGVDIATQQLRLGLPARRRRAAGVIMFSGYSQLVLFH